MPTPRLALLCSAALLVTACTSTPTATHPEPSTVARSTTVLERARQIRAGMSACEVRTILRTPADAPTSGGLTGGGISEFYETDEPLLVQVVYAEGGVMEGSSVRLIDTTEVGAPDVLIPVAGPR